MSEQYMTKKQAENMFKEQVDQKTLTPTDQRVYWNEHVETLARNGDISENKRMTWDTPSFIGKNYKK